MSHMEEEKSIEEQVKEHMQHKVRFLKNIGQSRVDSLGEYADKQGSHGEVHFLSKPAKEKQSKKDNDLF